MRRGDLWTMAGGADYASKPRPVLIVQSEAFDKTASVTICPLTSDLTGASFIRILVEPETTNGLRTSSHVMVDKITTVPMTKMGSRIGSLGPKEMTSVSRGLLVYLGLTT